MLRPFKEEDTMVKRVVVVVVSLLMLDMFAGGPLEAAPLAQAAVQSKASRPDPGTPPAPHAPLPPMTVDSSATGKAPAAVLLKGSLTAEQQQALAAVLDRYKPQLNEIARQLVDSERSRQATGGPTQSSATSAGIQAQFMDAQAGLSSARALLGQLKEVQSQIESETASILSAKQLALHRQALSGDDQSLSLVEAQVSPTPAVTQGSALAGGSDDFVSSACAVGAQYASWGRYYAYYANAYAYYNYIYNGDTYAYYAYLYLGYAQSHALSAIQYLGAAYFDITQLSSDFNGNGSSGISSAYNAQYYAYYGYYYANLSHHVNGSVYAQYAYLNGVYAYNNLYNAYYYGSYCH